MSGGSRKPLLDLIFFISLVREILSLSGKKSRSFKKGCLWQPCILHKEYPVWFFSFRALLVLYFLNAIFVSIVSMTLSTLRVSVFTIFMDASISCGRLSKFCL